MTTLQTSFRALIMVSCSKILTTTEDKPSEHLGVRNANLRDKKEAQNSTHQLREAPGTTVFSNLSHQNRNSHVYPRIHHPANFPTSGLEGGDCEKPPA